LDRGSFRLAAGDLDRFTEMRTSLRPTLTTTQQGKGSSPNGPDLDSAAAAGTAPDPGEPPFEQTADVSGTTNFHRRLPTPIPRVA
jgi:hypothetical protein